VVLRLQPVEGYKEPIIIKKGLQVSSASGPDDEKVIFETENEAIVTTLWWILWLAPPGIRLLLRT
jgi:hypothetical protein